MFTLLRSSKPNTPFPASPTAHHCRILTPESCTKTYLDGLALLEPSLQLLQSPSPMRDGVLIRLWHLGKPFHISPQSTQLKGIGTYVVPSYSKHASHPKSVGPRGSTIFPGHRP